MTTSGYWPARFGASEPLIPCAPWHIVQLSASVAPRPTASLPLARAIDRSRTTSVDTGGAARAASVAAAQLEGAPAARQMLAQSPCALKSACADGSQRKPTSIATTVRATRTPTLVRTHGLRDDIAPGSSITGSRSARSAPTL